MPHLAWYTRSHVLRAGDRDDIATELFALKCQLHMPFPNDADKVYSFFDFSMVRRSAKPKKEANKGSAPAA
jgi:hypothetical protein